MPTVFISHSKKDAQFAYRLAEDLRRLGVQVWIAPESIRPGESWVRAIERGLAESSHMVVVLTPAALQSKWVEKETDVAIARERKGRIEVIPLDVEPCEVPPLLSSYQTVPFRRDYDAGLTQLADILGVRVTPPEPARPPRYAPPVRRGLPNWKVVIALVTMLVSALVIGGVILEKGGREAFLAILQGGEPVVTQVPPPEITGFTRVPSALVFIGARISIYVNVKLHGHQIDNYRWVVEEGSIVSGQGESAITYEAPKTPGSYKVQVELEYEGGSVRDSMTVEVVLGPTSTATPTPRPTPTATPTPRPTPTATPTPRPTPTATPTPTPTPVPDALVNAEALNLRAGPGVFYDVLGVLKQGDPLKVTGKLPASDWLKVVTTGEQEGWVAASLLEINLSLAGVAIAQAPPTPTPRYTPTPTPTAAPTLLPPPTLTAPAHGEHLDGPTVTLEWRWDGVLGQDEYFLVQVLGCHSVKTKEPRYSGDLGRCRSGDHRWFVYVVSETHDRPLSFYSDFRPFYYDKQ